MLASHPTCERSVASKNGARLPASPTTLHSVLCKHPHRAAQRRAHAFQRNLRHRRLQEGGNMVGRMRTGGLPVCRSALRVRCSSGTAGCGGRAIGEPRRHRAHLRTPPHCSQAVSVCYRISIAQAMVPVIKLDV